MDENSFEYVNLNEIDPNMQVVPEGMYTFKVLKAELRKGISKTTNEPYELVNMTIAIQDDDNFSGRRMYESFFKGDSSLKQLRKIMDATGVNQAPGTPLTDWLVELDTIQPTFKAAVRHRLDVDKNGEAKSLDYKGNPTTLAKINFWSVVPS